MHHHDVMKHRLAAVIEFVCVLVWMFTNDIIYAMLLTAAYFFCLYEASFSSMYLYALGLPLSLYQKIITFKLSNLSVRGKCSLSCVHISYFCDLHSHLMVCDCIFAITSLSVCP